MFRKFKYILVIIFILAISLNLNIKVFGSGNFFTTLSGTVNHLNQTVEVTEDMYPYYGDNDNRWIYSGAEGFLNIPEQLTIKTYDVEDYGYCGFNIQYLTKPTIWGLFDGKAKVYGDDPIINIVPRELFVHRGQYTYIGQDYGFFVNTKSYESSGKYSATNIVDVLIFDIIVDHDNFGMTYTIKPLYTYTYLYISQTVDKQNFVTVKAIKKAI